MLLPRTETAVNDGKACGLGPEWQESSSSYALIFSQKFVEERPEERFR